MIAIKQGNAVMMSCEMAHQAELCGRTAYSMNQCRRMICSNKGTVGSSKLGVKQNVTELA